MKGITYYCRGSLLRSSMYRRIDCEQIRSRINQQLIAGRFRPEGLHQLRTKLTGTYKL